MTSVKVKFRPSAVSGKEGVVYYQVIKDRVVRQQKTSYRVYPSEWDPGRSSVAVPAAASDSRKDYLARVWQSVSDDLERLNAIVARCERHGCRYSAADVLAMFDARERSPLLFGFMRGVAARLETCGRVRTSEAYISALRSIMRFSGGRDMPIDDIDCGLMMSYEAWLRRRGVCPNTVSFYMRILRAVYNRAVECGLAAQRHPFRRVYTGVDKTVKRAVPLAAIRRMKTLDLASSPHLDFARDMFLFSFYTRGMSFVDMAYLRKKDVAGGMLAYRRRKTGRQLTVRWERCMREITSKYAPETRSTPYLLPLVKTGDDERRQYRNALCRVNNALKAIAPMVGLSMPLTMYCARHAWASIAKSKHIPLPVISEGMGHDSEQTTRIYLASLDTSVIDRANKLILDSL